MKSIATLYLDYLEKALVSMVLASLVLISVSGFVYGAKGGIPAALAVVTLALIACIEFGRRRVLKEHPEFKKEPFRETKLFLFMLQKKILKITNSIHMGSLQRNLSRITAIMIVSLIMLTLWSSLSISANITLKKNQAIVEAGPGVPATIFSKALVIQVIEISAPDRVTAIIHFEGYPDVKIENEVVGYQTTYVAGSHRFIVRIIEINNSSAKFFVERRVN